MAGEDLHKLDKVVHRCWTEEAFKDITLESKDGTKIRATRVVLSARSEIFQKLLLGSFESIFKIDLETAVLQAVVEYCYTDQASVLNWKAKAAAGPDDTFIPTLFQLQAAADELLLPGLSATIADCVKSYLDEFPMVCFGAYEAWKKSGEDASPELGEILLGRVRSTEMSSLKEKSFASLSEGTVKQLLTDEKMQATELDLFNFLTMWVAGGPGRKNAAMDMVELIKLQDIAPMELGAKVANSGLVTPDQLMEAYKNQALAAANQQPVKFERRRFSVAPMWTKTMTDLSSPDRSRQNWKADVLEFPPITTGKYEWSLEFVHVDEGEIGYSWLGIASTAIELIHTKPLDEQKGCWGVNDRCRGVHEGGTAFADFDTELGEGSSVNFTLDLTPEQEDGGILFVEVIVDGLSHKLGKFENLLEHLKENPGAGYVPAMSIRDCCVVKAKNIPQQVA